MDMPMEKVNPNRWGNRGEQGTSTSSQSLGAVLRRSSHDTYTAYRSHIPVRISRVFSTGIQRPSQHSAAMQDQAHSRPVAASQANQDAALPLLGKTGPSQVLNTSSLVGRRASQEISVKYRSRIPVRVSRVGDAGIQGPSQQSAAMQDRAHSLPVAAPMDKQDPELPLPHTEENISSTPLPGPEKNGKDLNVISQTEPSHVLKTSSLVWRPASYKTYIKYRSYITQKNPRK